MKNNRIIFLDSLRGTAVAIGILYAGFVCTASLDIFDAEKVFMQSFAEFLYCIFVPVLMCISGYVFALKCMDNKYTSLSERIFTRLKRLAVIYGVFQSVLLILRFIFSEFVTYPVNSFSSLVAELIFPNSHLWYIWVLFFYYILNIVFNFSKYSDFLIVIALMLVGSLSCLFLPQWGVSASAVNFFRCLPFFELGKIIRWRITPINLPDSKNIKLIFGTVILIMSSVMLIFGVNNSFFEMIYSMLVLIFVFYLITTTSFLRSKSIVSAIGEKAIIYCIFYSFIMEIFKFLFKLFMPSGILMAVILSCVTLAVVFFLSYFLRNNKLVNKLFKKF